MLERVLIATSRTELNVDLLLDLIRNMPVGEVTLVHCVESVLPWPRRDRRLVRRAEEQLNHEESGYRPSRYCRSHRTAAPTPSS